MATQAFVRRHKIIFGDLITPTAVASDFDEHKLADGLGKDYWMQAYLDSDSQNEVLTNDGRALINAPLRSSLIVSSAAIASTATLTAFSKSAILRAGHANVPGAVIEVTAGGRISAKASSPGGIALHLTVAGSTIFTGGTNASDLIASVTNGRWSALVRAKVRAAGASGSIDPSFALMTLPTLTPSVIAGTGVVTVDLTVDRSVEVFADWETADAANSIVLDDLTVSVSLPGEVGT